MSSSHKKKHIITTMKAITQPMFQVKAKNSQRPNDNNTIKEYTAGDQLTEEKGMSAFKIKLA